jgi:transglutaminase-like putative cysteine protease
VHARYVLVRSGDAGLAVPQHHVVGYDQRARRLPDGRTEVAVAVRPGPLRSRSPWPRPPGDGATAASLSRAEPLAAPDDVGTLAEELAHGARTQMEVSERILTWVALNVEHADAPGHDESAAATLASRAATCVGRSLLAADLLRAAGIPARTIHAVRVPPDAGRGAVLGSAEFVLHRTVETWIDDLGWVPSDPGASVHVVDARLLVLGTDDEEHDAERERDLLLVVARPPLGLPLALRAALPLGTPVLLVRPVAPDLGVRP